MGDRSLARQIADLPDRPGIYAFRDRRGRLLYVGKAVNLKRRAASYLERSGGHTGYTRGLKRRAARIETLETGSELEALLAEARAIREQQPVYNVAGRHARHYAFVKVTRERFPRVLAVREIAPDGASYYGPFPPELGLDDALAALQPVLRWRRCDVLERKPCLHQQVGRCLAPCGAGPGESRYAGMLATLDSILRGEGMRVLALLEERMRAAAAHSDFERAARLRDRLQALERVLQRAPFLTLDVVAAVRRGPGAARLLGVRAGRLVAAREVRGPGEVAAFLEAAFSGPPPGPATLPADLREVDVVTGYLARHAGSRWLVRADQAMPSARTVWTVMAARA
ncbi:MAG: UvrB/UvrC motif-containing protein [Candidatus Sericytochromatia bacterium]|nr:UvrB/UvrC motif-containing protein [Candidatus Tanganyikabacteria bacterium]